MRRSISTQQLGLKLHVNSVLNMQYSLIILLLLGLLLPACQPIPAERMASGKDTLQLFIMAGQSNMAGRGIVGPEDTNSNYRILVLDTLGQLVLAQEPLHHDHPGGQGLDCGLSFAQQLLPALPTNARVALLPCAVGSSAIVQWLGDSLVQQQHIYSRLVQLVKMGTAKGHLAGLLWLQGEEDAQDSRSKCYAKQLAAFFTKIRGDLETPTMPVLSGKLPLFQHLPFKAVVNAGIDSVAASLPGVYLVPTDDLGCNPDRLHYNAAAQRLLGARMAQVATQLLSK